MGVSGAVVPPRALPVPCPGRRSFSGDCRHTQRAAPHSVNVTQLQGVTKTGTENGISGEFGQKVDFEVQT